MMDNDKINLIFDCDGTLLDSYGAITDNVCRMFSYHGITCSPDEVRTLLLTYHTAYCIETLAERYGLSTEQLKAPYRNEEENEALITLIPHAKELLEDGRFNAFVYTHRGENCRTLFKSLGIYDYFTEIVDRSYGFKRKPDSEGVDYLVEKYGLDKNRTYYVGDRSIDIECGLNAGTGTIFLKSSGLDIDTSAADFTVDDLLQIRELPFERRERRED